MKDDFHLFKRMSDSENKEPALCPKAKKRGKRSATSLAKRKKKYQEAQRGFLIKQQRALLSELDVVKEELVAKKLELSLATKKKSIPSRVSNFVPRLWSAKIIGVPKLR